MNALVQCLRMATAGALLALSVQSYASQCPADFPAALEVERDRLVLQGTGTLYYWVFSVYDAALYAPPGAADAQLPDPGVPVCLEVCYHRDVSREDIARAADRILARQNEAAQLQRIEPQLQRIRDAYGDVSAGDRFRMCYTPPGVTIFTLNGKSQLRVQGVDAGMAYMGIWLSDPPLSRELREALLSRPGSVSLKTVR